ncbi:hypothetical protein CKN73_07450 [Carnobacterium divergens]|uniref:hypothetical protein n=1 Tax=Carnobacterium divergens TaxID=2748 RepID=UPI0010722EEB|nr:hypothetical protein [Carnobacterium divergens]TFJ40149.1 hypothetical protein CKN77_07550 [Carnobacterium divergens]TFJ48770.1 hypothetical protein CKN73_07450 [Carnobacterium divergens]TFJ54034.1 hypothetical protein CKN83_07355 [Carnobacterium divergens]TFJ59560.1 hypothetical protein CKN89_07795 [Carnobacterium divergens]TFJ70204.1 hypothetical protein CKN91_07410 [Carnobacterium divergens]
MEIINGMLSGGIVAVLCGIVFFGIPKIFEGLIYKGLEFKIQKAIADSNADAAIELEKIKNNNQKKLQEELEKLRLENTEKINTMQIEFQVQYQNAEHDFNKRIDLLKMKYTVLPMLFEKLMETYSCLHYNNLINLDDRLDFNNKINNFKRLILINKFYLSEDIYSGFIDCKDKIVDLYSIKEKITKNILEDTCNSELSEEYSSEDESYSQLFDELSKKISEEMV